MRAELTWTNVNKSVFESSGKSPKKALMLAAVLSPLARNVQGSASVTIFPEIEFLRFQLLDRLGRWLPPALNDAGEKRHADNPNFSQTVLKRTRNFWGELCQSLSDCVRFTETSQAIQLTTSGWLTVVNWWIPILPWVFGSCNASYHTIWAQRKGIWKSDIFHLQSQ